LLTRIIMGMGTRDQLHPQVVSALRKDGWTITHDPYVVPLAGTYAEIDLGAEKLIAAEKGARRIAVEVKSFMGPSTVSEFHTALGQYLDYSVALSEHDPERTLHPFSPQKREFCFPFCRFLDAAAIWVVMCAAKRRQGGAKAVTRGNCV